ncbi:MAG TPA: hypothetical protein EYG83_04245 [Sulfurospirillum arcachonense]|nr:hypothetical protein [Sulfurospirillum arcachonense]
MAKYEYVGNDSHRLYLDSVPRVIERYNHKEASYQKINFRTLEMLIFRIDSFLKTRKIRHALFFNKLLFWNKPKYRERSSFINHRLYIGSFNSHNSSLYGVFHELKKASSHDKLELIINSTGGSIEEGWNFYNIIQSKFYNKTVAYLDNHGYSMGAILFCMASKRVIYVYSNLMFHNYSSRTGGKGGEILANIEHSDVLISKFMDEIIVQQGFLSEEEYGKLRIGQDYWMSSRELCERGIATHVIIEGKEFLAEEYLKIKQE